MVRDHSFVTGESINQIESENLLTSSSKYPPFHYLPCPVSYFINIYLVLSSFELTPLSPLLNYNNIKQGGGLAKQLQIAENEIAEMVGYRIRVVESSGTQLCRLLPNTNPWAGHWPALGQSWVL